MNTRAGYEYLVRNIVDLYDGSFQCEIYNTLFKSWSKGDLTYSTVGSFSTINNKDSIPEKFKEVLKC